MWRAGFGMSECELLVGVMDKKPCSAERIGDAWANASMTMDLLPRTHCPRRGLSWAWSISNKTAGSTDTDWPGGREREAM